MYYWVLSNLSISENLRLRVCLNAKLKNYWEKNNNHFYEKLILEMSDLLRCSPSSRHFQGNFSLPATQTIGFQGKTNYNISQNHSISFFNFSYTLAVFSIIFQLFKHRKFWIWIHSALASRFKNWLHRLRLWNVTKKWVF